MPASINKPTSKWSTFMFVESQGSIVPNLRHHVPSLRRVWAPLPRRSMQKQMPHMLKRCLNSFCLNTNPRTAQPKHSRERVRDREEIRTSNTATNNRHHRGPETQTHLSTGNVQTCLNKFVETCLHENPPCISVTSKPIPATRKVVEGKRLNMLKQICFNMFERRPKF